jgi:Fic family protein
MTYIHERKDWPRFSWRVDALAELLSAVRYQQGLLLGRMRALGHPLQKEATLAALTEETVKSSAIEGEVLNPASVRSSLARRMGLSVAGAAPIDRNIEGIVEMMLDATRNYGEPLTYDRLFGWHAALFPSGRSGMQKIRTGAWREGGIQVISGAVGTEKVHLEAPVAERVEAEMSAFLAWFNGSEEIEPLIKAGLAHLYFVTIHPFEDGNGRIARAITEMCLARLENSAQRFYSMSSQIREERRGYYEILESTQKSKMDVTDWLIWFLRCLGHAIEKANALTGSVLEKDAFWRRLKEKSIGVSDRQKKVVNLLLDAFEGKLTTDKWAKLTKSSHDTALRDIQDLIAKGILKQEEGGGRSTSYCLVHTGKQPQV